LNDDDNENLIFLNFLQL